LALKRASKLTLLSVLIMAHALGQQLTTMAMLDFEPFGISSVESAILTNRMRSQLVKTGKVTVVERGMMQQVLAEQDFQMAGCTSDECAVEVGRLLGVTNMVAGSIGKIGTTYAMDIRVIDVESGAIARTVTQDFQGTVDGLLKEIERLAWAIVTEEEIPPISIADVASSSEELPPETGAPPTESEVRRPDASAIKDTATSPDRSDVQRPLAVRPGQPETGAPPGESEASSPDASALRTEERPEREDEPSVPPIGFIPHNVPPALVDGYGAFLREVKYPEAAVGAGIEGVVVVQAFVDQTGKVIKTNIMKGIPGGGLNEAAVAAVRRARFKPAEYRGKPVGVWAGIRVPFKL